jgi:hypothetical protein
MRRPRHRGLIKKRVQAYLTATVVNIERMARLLWKPRLVAQPVFQDLHSADLLTLPQERGKEGHASG